MNAAPHRAPPDGLRTQGVTPSESGTGEQAPSQHPIVLFDGPCSLCSAAVRWLIRRDSRGRLRFASLQSRAAEEALRDRGATDRRALPDSLVLIDDTGIHVRSEAALRIAVALGGPYRMAGLARVVPRSLRDAVYRWVARNRTRWFGRVDRCMRPPPGMDDRFLDADEDPGES